MIRAASASPYCRARSTVFGSEIAPSRNRHSARTASRCAAPICRLSWCTATPWSSSHLAASRRPRARQASSTPPRPRKVSAKSQPASRRRCSRSMSPSCAASARPVDAALARRPGCRRRGPAASRGCAGAAGLPGGPSAPCRAPQRPPGRPALPVARRPRRGRSRHRTDPVRRTTGGTARRHRRPGASPNPGAGVRPRPAAGRGSRRLPRHARGRVRRRRRPLQLDRTAVGQLAVPVAASSAAASAASSRSCSIQPRGRGSRRCPDRTVR